MSELKPCPFCGDEPYFGGTRHSGKYTIVERDASKHNVFWYTCKGCNKASTMHVDTKQLAMEQWNTRHNDTMPTVEEVWERFKSASVIMNAKWSNEGVIGFVYGFIESRIANHKDKT